MSQPSEDVRRQSLEAYYIASHGELRGAAYDQHPQLLVWDCDAILTRLAGQLDQYHGLLTLEDFTPWAVGRVQREARRVLLTETILRDNSRIIGAAVRRGLEGLPDECSVNSEDIASEVSALVYRYAESLGRQGAAKQSTRITALVLKHIWQYHGSYRVRHHRRLRKLVSEGDVLQMGEVLTPEQIAAERVSERNAVAA